MLGWVECLSGKYSLERMHQWNLKERLGDSTRVLFYMLLLALIGIGDSCGIYLAYPIALPCLQPTLAFLRLEEV